MCHAGHDATHFAMCRAGHDVTHSAMCRAGHDATHSAMCRAGHDDTHSAICRAGQHTSLQCAVPGMMPPTLQRCSPTLQRHPWFLMVSILLHASNSLPFI